MNDIRKAAGIIIRDKKLLVERSINKEFFIAPGGSIESGETPEQALIRELKEEFTLDIAEEDLEFFGEFTAEAAGMPGVSVTMTIYIVKSWAGEPKPASEVEQIAWVTSLNEQGLKLGSIFEHEVIPRLKAKGLIK